MADKAKTTTMPNSFGFGQAKPQVQKSSVPIGRGRAHLNEDLSGVDEASEKHGYGRTVTERSARPKAERATDQWKVRVTPTMLRQIQDHKDSQVGLTNAKLLSDMWEAYKEKNPTLFK